MSRELVIYQIFQAPHLSVKNSPICPWANEAKHFSISYRSILLPQVELKNEREDRVEGINFSPSSFDIWALKIYDVNLTTMSFVQKEFFMQNKQSE